MGVSHPPVSRRSVGNTSKQPYFHLSACRRSSRAGIQSAIQGEWVFTRRIEDCAKPKAPGVSQAALALGRSLDGAEEQSLLHEVANGLMDLAEDVQYSLIVLSCLNDSWALIRDQAVPTAHARYSTIVELQLIPSAEVGKALVAAYLREAYARAGFTPEYSTWPVRTTAFDDAILFSPRSLITVVQDHCVRCRENGCVTELTQLPNEIKGSEPLPRGQRLVGGDPPPPDPELDQRFSRLVQEANVADALDEKKVDYGLPPLLRAGLTAWTEENPAAGDFSVDPPLGRNPSLHARLRRIVDADSDDEVHSSFRAVLNANPVAALHRLRAAVTASGLELSGERRRLFILRNAAWSQGLKTRQALDELGARGGTVMMLPQADLAVFRALQQLLEEKPTGLAAWLRTHRHASRTALLAPLSPEPAVASAPTEAGAPPKAAAAGGATAPPKAAVLTKAAEPANVDTPPKVAEPAQSAEPGQARCTGQDRRTAQELPHRPRPPHRPGLLYRRRPPRRPGRPTRTPFSSAPPKARVDT